MPNANHAYVRILVVVLVATGCATVSPQLQGTSEPLFETGAAEAVSGNDESAAEESKPMPSPLDAVGEDLADAFWGYNLLYYAGAFAATGVMAYSGADQEVREHVLRDFKSGTWDDVGHIAGYVVPSVTAPAIWLVGLASNDRTVAGAGSAALLALGVTTATTGVLKFAVGRPHPGPGEQVDGPESAEEFSPFQNRLGSWPSGHAASTVSIAAALTGYAPDKYWIPLIGYPLGIGLGLVMVERDSHWASDVVAGALIGHGIGYSIGRNFRKRVRGEQTAEQALQIVPLAGARGVAVSGRW